MVSKLREYGPRRAFLNDTTGVPMPNELFGPDPNAALDALVNSAVDAFFEAWLPEASRGAEGAPGGPSWRAAAAAAVGAAAAILVSFGTAGCEAQGSVPAGQALPRTTEQRVGGLIAASCTAG